MQLLHQLGGVASAVGLQARLQVGQRTVPRALVSRTVHPAATLAVWQQAVALVQAF